MRTLLTVLIVLNTAVASLAGVSVLLTMFITESTDSKEFIPQAFIALKGVALMSSLSLAIASSAFGVILAVASLVLRSWLRTAFSAFICACSCLLWAFIVLH